MRKSDRRTIDKARRHPGSPPPGGSAMGGQPMADPHWQNARGSANRTPRAGDPLQGPQFAPFCDTTRRFTKFGGSNDIQIRRNKDHYDRIEERFTTMQEPHR